MNLRFTPRALSEAERMKTWWQKNRPTAPSLFDDEMARAVEQMRASPTLGTAYPSSFGLGRSPWATPEGLRSSR
jgi:plasmid stabilization system protein ParE